MSQADGPAKSTGVAFELKHDIDYE